MKEFGIKRENEERRDGGCGVIFDPQSQKYAVGKHRDSGVFVLFGGGVGSDENAENGVVREVKEESGLYDFLYIEKIGEALSHFYNNSKKINRVANSTCFLFVLRSRNLIPTQLEEHENFTLLWSTPKEMLENWKSRNQNKDYDHWIYFFKKSAKRAKELGYDTSTIFRELEF